jgi:valyl-tRNA synthetase
MAIDEKFLSGYEPQKYEDTIYRMWEESGFFNPDVCIEKGVTKEDAEHFSIVLPPPNVTGTLHTGHASMLAIQDTMVRFARMKGLKTLWLPGTDHAAIATQSKVEKDLEKEKIRKHDLGREEFLKRVDEFAQKSHDTIVSQCRKMGSSLDWSREAFTLDDTRHKAVFVAFKKMYEEGLIYQKHRIVNWDPKGQTTISDDEVVREDRKGTMYIFKYSHDFPFPIATTRPETKLGDTAVAVHPEDSRYQEYIGKEYSFNFAGEDVTVKIVADEAVDPEFGVGALGVTSAHSQTDWEIAERHNLPVKQIINEYGKMIVGMEGVVDTKVEQARKAVVQWLQSERLLISEKEIDQSVGTAERTGAIIEPLPKMQWWIDVNKPIKDGKSLKDLMLDVVRDGQIEILPNRFKKIYFHWVENLRDWNISRQIWYGHRVPMWYKDGKMKVSEKKPAEGWMQDEDTLDTWFSSGLWTFSTLLDPEKYNEDFKTWLKNSRDGMYHPTNVLETGYDILPFWVARMILMTTYLVDEVPFKTVYLHGLVRDKNGRKMSKSLGNIVNPLDLIELYGTDALRMSMIVGVGPGADNNLSDEKIKAYKKFANKIWNATRFVLENVKDFNFEKPNLLPKHQAFITQWNELLPEITKEMEEYKLYLVGEKLYHFFWHNFADIVIEKCKIDIHEGNDEAKKSAQYTLYHLLTEQLKALHPFMPFITEEIWQSLPHKDSKMLMVAKWPK